MALARKGRPLEDAIFFNDVSISVWEFFGEQTTEIVEIMRDIPLSRRTGTRRIEDVEEVEYNFGKWLMRKSIRF